MSRFIRKVKTGKSAKIHSVRKNPQISLTRGLLLISGLTLILLSFLLEKGKLNSVHPASNSNIISSVSFANEPVLIDKTFLNVTPAAISNKIPPERVIVPSVNIDVPVAESKIINGYWEVFQDKAGFGLGSAYPDDEGNQVIFAHARDKLFGPLKNIKKGANIIVMTKDKWYTYTVSDIKEVSPSQIEVIKADTKAKLTLYTCSGYADSKRLIVVAQKNI